MNERVVIRVRFYMVAGGMRVFKVRLEAGESNNEDRRARDKVASRLTAYFKGRKDILLRCSTLTRKRVNCTNAKSEDKSEEGACVTATECRFSSRPAGPCRTARRTMCTCPMKAFS